MTQRVVNYTYGTGNPVLPDGSIDVRDGIDNLQSMDVLMNAPEDTYNQRDGKIVRTVAGMNNEFDTMIVGMNSEFDTMIDGMNSEFDAQILNIGFTRIGTFAAGATLTNPRQTLLWDIADGGDGQEYGWSGSFLPSGKIVPPNSTPASTGGIAVGAWMSRFDPELRIQVREALRRSYAEAGYTLVAGSFEAGGTVTAATDVLLYEADGKAYSYTGTLPHTVVAGTSPTVGWVDRSSYVLAPLTRSSLISWALGANLDSGSIVEADGLKYRRVTGSTAIPDFLGFEPEGVASPRHWGAPGDGVTDESPFFQSALNWLALNPARFMKEDRDVTRKFTGGLKTGGHLRWDIGSAKYVIDYDGMWLDACGNRTPAFYALPSEYVIGSVNVPVAPLPVAPKQGDWIRIISNAVNPNDRTRIGNPNKYRVQEYAQVGAGSTTTNIVLETPLKWFEGVDYAETSVVNAYSPTWNARVVLVDTSKKFELSGGNISYPTGKTYGPTAISCRAYYKPKCSNLEFRHVYGTGIYLDGTLFAEAEDVSGYDFADNEAGVQNGYVVCDGGYFTKVTGALFGKARHGYTTLRVSLADNTLAAFSGGNTVSGRVIDSNAFGGISGAFNTHHGSVDIRFIGCYSDGGGDSAFGGRGLDCWVIGCKSRGVSGSGLKWIREAGGIAGMLSKYAPSVTVVDSDLFGSTQVLTAQYARVLLQNTIFRSNTLRQLIAVSSDVSIQGNVEFITDSMNGAHPIAPPISSFPVSITADNANPWLVGNNRLRIDGGAVLELHLTGFSTLPDSVFNVASGAELHLSGKLRAFTPDGVNLMFQGATRVISTPTAEIEILDSNSATITFGALDNKAKAYTSLGTPLISGIEFHGAAGDGFIIKEPSGAMTAYGTKSLGTRKASGTGTYDSPYRTNTSSIALGATFVGTPAPVMQYKVAAGASDFLRRGVVEYDTISTTSIGGVRGCSLASDATDAAVTVSYHVIGRWK